MPESSTASPKSAADEPTKPDEPTKADRFGCDEAGKKSG